MADAQQTHDDMSGLAGNSLHIGGDAVDKLAALGAAATGVEIVEVTMEVPGAPSKIPLAIFHGDQPRIAGVSEFFEKYRYIPERKAGTANVLTLQSLIDLTNRHKTGDSAVFAKTDWQSPSITSVIDYHENVSAGEPNNGKHRVCYQFPLSEEWKVWTENNATKMSQGEFAAFLEDRIAELSTPTAEERRNLEADFATTVATPAELIQLSRGLQVAVSQTVKTVQTLQTGESQIVFEESHDAKGAGGASIKVPGIFILAIAPFFMGEKVRIPVRLRYRTGGGGVTWFYQIYRPDQFVTERVRSDLAEVGDATGLPTFEGTPEMPA